MIRASGFPRPLRSPTFPQRCSGASLRALQVKSRRCRRFVENLPLGKFSNRNLYCPRDPPVLAGAVFFIRASRAALSKGLDTGVSMVAIRSDQGMRSARIEQSHPSGTRSLSRAVQDHSPERAGWHSFRAVFLSFKLRTLLYTI